MDFSKRSVITELMDNPAVPITEVEIALQELELINKFLGGRALLLNALPKAGFKDYLTIMDLGSGSGDMLRIISNYAKKKGFLSIRLFGVDINPAMTTIAKYRSGNFPEIKFVTQNIWNDELFDYKPDILINNHFCHHFDDEQLIELVKRMCKLARKSIIINDLHRHKFAYYSIKFLTALFSKSYLVKNDGPLSVARALTKMEWKNILFKAGISNYEINWKWAFRWQIIILK